MPTGRCAWKGSIAVGAHLRSFARHGVCESKVCPVFVGQTRIFSQAFGTPIKSDWVMRRWCLFYVQVSSETYKDRSVVGATPRYVRTLWKGQEVTGGKYIEKGQLRVRLLWRLTPLDGRVRFRLVFRSI